jgi:4-hydroxy-tetrahydrodipicolinate synthase
MSSEKTPIRGLLVPNITPTDAKGRLDEDCLRHYLDWIIGTGIDGLYPNGSTGEFLRFTPEERRRVMGLVVEHTAGRVPVLAGAAEANVQETIATCNAYGELGVRAVAVVAPFYYRLSPEGVYEYFRAIADEVRIDLTLYNIPLFASPIDVETVRRLAIDCPRVVGIKDSSGDLPHMMRMIAAVRTQRPEFSFLTGWDASLAMMFLIGCDGGTNASSGVVPELTIAIRDAIHAGEVEHAIGLQYRLTPLFDAMVGASEFPEGFRAGLRARGIELGASRQPLSSVQRAQSKALEDKLQEMIGTALQGLELSDQIPFSGSGVHV